MDPLNVQLAELIGQVDTELVNAAEVDKIGEAQRRAHTLTDLGDRLVGHYVEQAREAGASWTEIGEAIGVSEQAARQRWESANFARFTRRARNVVVLAQESARGRGDEKIGTEHLLIGLLGEPEGVAGQVLIELAGSADTITQALAVTADPKAGDNAHGDLPLAEPAKQALELAFEESRALMHNYVGTEHILLGLLAVPHGQAAPTLAELGIGAEVVRPKVLHALAGFGATS